MGYTLLSIIPRIAARLNDSAQQMYTNDVILPLAQDAADELQAELDLYGILVLEHVTNPPIVVPQMNPVVPGSSISLDGLGLLPLDMLEPQKLEERLSGSTDMFMPMIRRQWEPAILPTDSLRYWDYREENIFFIGATTDREIKISYIKRLVVINDVNSVISVNNSTLFMINRTAALCAEYIGENKTRADSLNAQANDNMAWIIRIGTKSKQGTRTRRRPFVIAGRRRWA